MIESIFSAFILGVMLTDSSSFDDFVTKIFIVFISCLGTFGVMKTINKK